MKRLLLIIFLFVLAGSGDATAATWRVAVAQPKRRERLNAISCASSGRCAAVGYWEPGPFLRRPGFAENEVHGAWQRHGGLYTGESVDCLQRWCVAVGALITSGLRAEAWDGLGWSSQPLTGPPLLYSGSLRSVSCASRRFCVAVGDANALTTVDCPPDPAIPECITSVPVVERWNGSRWSQVVVPEPAIAVESLPRAGDGPSITLTAVSCSEASACMAIGDWTTLDQLQRHQLFAEQWDGRSWRLVAIPQPGDAQDASLAGISCSAPNACTAVGSTRVHGDHLLVERFNGRRWHVQRLASPARSKTAAFAAVACPSVKSCTAVGGDRARNGSQKPLAERWNGSRWTIQPTPGLLDQRQRGGAVFTGVSCPAALDCDATAEYGDTHGWAIEQYGNS